MKVSTRRLDIQVLRGVCVLAVVLFHFFPETFSQGYLGVDVFFLISGFLLLPRMLELGIRPKNKISSFYLQRFARLTPALFATTSIFCIWIALFGPLEDQRFAFAQGITAILNLSNFEAFRLSQGNYFTPNPNGLLHTWSLSAEQQLYLITPLLFMTIRSVRKRVGVVHIFFILLTVVFLITTYSQIEIFPLEILNNKNFYYFSPFFRAFEFFLGGIVKLQEDKLRHNLIKNRLLWVLFVMLLLVETPGNLGVLTILIVAGLLISNSKDNISEKNRMLAFGDASYSIYLVHLPIIYMLNYYFEKKNVFHFALAIALILFLGFFSWRQIETRFKNHFLSIPKNSQVKTAASLYAVCLAFLVVLRIASVNYYWVGTPPILGGTIECPAGDYGNCGEYVPNKRNYLLIGDSHAAAVSGTFKTVFAGDSSNGVIMYGRGCPLLDPSTLGAKESSPCIEYMRNVYMLLQKYDFTVIVVQRSSLSASDRKMYLENLSAAINHISTLSKKVYVISPNYEFRKGHSQGNFAQLFESNICVRSNLLNNIPLSDFVFLKKKTELFNVSYINSGRIFSGNDCQYLKKNGNYLYWDSNHLSENGASLYKSTFKKILVKNNE